MELLYSLRRPSRWPALALALATAGCASLPPGAGRDEIASLVLARGRTLELRSEAEASSWVAQQLAQPLSADSAVRIALAWNPRLRAEYARLGIASAEVHDAGRLSNPRLSASVLSSNQAGALDQVTFGLAQSFTSLLLLGPRSRFAQGEFLRIQQSIGAEILKLAAEAEGAFYELVGAQQTERMRAAVARAAGLSAALAQRFFDAGNITRLELSLEQAAASQASLDLLEAQGKLADARAGLNTLMGLKGAERAWTVTSGLPSPLPLEDELPALLRLAGESRLDLVAARSEVELLAGSLGLARRFRFLGEVEVGVETERETDGSRLTGPQLSLELPLFNQGRGAIARAQAQLQDAEARLQELEIAVSNAVQLASLRVANAKARAEVYRSALIPQREQIVARTQEQVNFMLVGQFELLRAKQEEYDAYQGYLEAVASYWVARTELAREVGARLPSSTQTATDVLDAEALTRPKAGAMGDMDHGEPEGMGGMDHDMPGMDHSGDGMKHQEHDMQQMDQPGKGLEGMRHEPPATQKPRGKGKGAVSRELTPRATPGQHKDLPTGMESQIPAPAKAGPGASPPEKDSGEPATHEHGDPQ